MKKAPVLIAVFSILLTQNLSAAFSTRYFTESLAGCTSNSVIPKKSQNEFCLLADYVQQNISPLQSPLHAFTNEDVILLGDTHPNKRIKSWLAGHLETLKSAGFTHVGLEALNSESQMLLDQYQHNPSLRLDVLNLITSDWGWIPEDHLHLIDAIHKSGLELLALDNRNELERKGLGDSLQLRNEHMAEILTAKLIQSKSARIVVLTGKVHSALFSEDNDGLTLPQVLKQLRVQVSRLI